MLGLFFLNTHTHTWVSAFFFERLCCISCRTTKFVLAILLNHQLDTSSTNIYHLITVLITTKHTLHNELKAKWVNVNNQITYSFVSQNPTCRSCISKVQGGKEKKKRQVWISVLRNRRKIRTSFLLAVKQKVRSTFIFEKIKSRNDVSTYSQILWQMTARWLLLKSDLPTNLITAIIHSLF